MVVAVNIGVDPQAQAFRAWHVIDALAATNTVAVLVAITPVPAGLRACEEHYAPEREY